MSSTEKSRGLDSVDPMGSRTQDLCKCAWWWNPSRVSFHGQEEAAPPVIHDPRVTCPLLCHTEPGLNPATSGHPRLGALGPVPVGTGQGVNL